MRVSRLVALGAAGAVVAGLIGVGPANAAYISTSPPAYDNGTISDPQSIGSIALYDAAGNAVTSGTLTDLGGAIYAVGGSTPRSNATKATLSVAAPDHTKVSALWSSQIISASTNFPVAGSIPNVSSATGPVATITAGEGNIASFLSVASLDTTDGYSGYLQLRLKDSGPGLGGATTWATMEIAFDGAAGTWQQVYPVAAAIGTNVSTPSASPVSPQNFGVPISLSATATPAGVAGNVTFYDFGTAVPQAQNLPVNAVTGVATSPSLTPAVGEHDYTAIFTPTAAGYNASPESGLLIFNVVQAVLPPISQTSVTTTGAHVVDQTLTCVNGTWSNTPTSFTYAWLLNGSTISGKTTNKLLQTAAMVGKNVICRVTATNLGGSGYDDSAAGVVAKANFVNRAKPAIGGVLKVGKLLTASTGTWTPAGTSYTYQWKRGSVVIGRAKTYKATAKDKGKILVVIVTAARAGYNSRAISSLGKKIS